MADPFSGIGAALGAGVGAMLDPGDLQHQRMLEDDAFDQLISTSAPQLAALGPSALEKIKADPVLRQAVMSSIDKLGTIGASGGLDPETRATVANTQGAVNADNAGRVGAIRQEMARTGRAGSGFDLGAQMANAQGQAANESQAGSNIVGQAAQRALQAYGQRASAANTMQGQEYDLAGKTASAADAIARFNQGLPLQQYEVNKDAAQTRAGADQYGAGVYGQRYGQAVDTGAGIGRAAGAAAGLAVGAADPSAYASMMGTDPTKQRRGYGYGGGGGY